MRNGLLMCVCGIGISFLGMSATVPEKTNVEISVNEAAVVVLSEEEKLEAELAEAEAGLQRLFEGIDYGKAAQPKFELFRKSLIGYLRLKENGSLKNEGVLSIIDFSLPSRQKRLWIIDLEKKKLLYHELVAHGKNSGGDMATSFSNIPNSNQSSLGFYVTSHTYFGKHGLSLRLQGMEKGYNDNAMRRAIVLHGAKYVNEGIVKNLGRLGRSFGCPSVRQEVYKPIIHKIKDGSCLFIYYPDANYLSGSEYLADETLALQYFMKNKLSV